MSNSLKDQLAALGFKPAPAPEKPAREAQGPRRDGGGPRRDGQRPGGPRGDAPRGDGRRDGQRPGGEPRRDGARPGGPSGAKPGGGAAGQARPGGGRGGQRQDGARRGGKPRSQEEIDLGKAYALRAEAEKRERIAAEAARQEEARLKREARAKLAEFLQGRPLNDPAAEIARHFEYGGKIKRIYVTEPQLKALNAGELGVVQQDGRYLLLSRADLEQARAIFAQAIALEVDPNAPAGEDPYADPQYQVPDDLVW
jgi:uncharacterized protein YaiL (DUF2058 family)